MVLRHISGSTEGACAEMQNKILGHVFPEKLVLPAG